MGRRGRDVRRWRHHHLSSTATTTPSNGDATQKGLLVLYAPHYDVTATSVRRRHRQPVAAPSFNVDT